MFWSKAPTDLPSPEALQQQLGINLRISPEDLEANRQGRLSAAQQQQYAATMKQGQKTGIIMVGLVLLISAGVIGWQIYSNAGSGNALRQAFETNPVIPIVGIGGSLLLYIIIMAYAFLRSANTDPATVKVSSVSGKIKLSSVQAWGQSYALAAAAGAATRSIIVQVGRQKIYSTNESVESALVNGAEYTVYFVKTGGVGYFISAEVKKSA